MTVTRELRTTIAFTLAVALALTAFVLGNQRQVHADVLDIGEQVNCYIEKGFSDGFDMNYDYCGNTEPGESGDPSLAEQIICLVDWRLHEADPEIPFEPDVDYCEMLEQDICPNIPGVQETVPEGKVLEGGICIDAHGGGGSGADLSIIKTVSDTSPAPSSTVIYTITVQSSGPATASGVSVSDMLPSGVSHVSNDGAGAYVPATGLWTIGSIASGTAATLHITVTVMATSGVEVVNTASIAASNSTDPNTGNNTSVVSFTSTQDQGAGNPQCSDGIDNDNDGAIDFPADVNCTDASDNKEEEDVRNGGGGGGSRRNSSGGSSNNNDDDGEVLGAQTECPMYLTGYIKPGAQNDAGEVAKLQVFLNSFEGNILQVSGTYDASTIAAVNAFQRKYSQEVLEPWGLTGVTGHVYYTTQKQVNSIFCEFRKDFPLSISQIEEIAYVRAIQPQIRAQANATVAAPAAAAEPAAPGLGQTVLPQTQIDENAAGGQGDVSQGAAAANASSTPGWFGRFVNWLFGR